MSSVKSSLYPSQNFKKDDRQEESKVADRVDPPRDQRRPQHTQPPPRQQTRDIDRQTQIPPRENIEETQRPRSQMDIQLQRQRPRSQKPEAGHGALGHGGALLQVLEDQLAAGGPHHLPLVALGVVREPAAVGDALDHREG